MKVLIVDDHALFADGLACILERMECALTSVKAANCREAFEQAGRHTDIKLVLLDLGLPGMSGFEALPIFRERYPDVPVVVCSANADRESVLKALDQGAMGYIPKTSSEESLVGALRVIFAGGVYLPRSVLGQPLAPATRQPQSSGFSAVSPKSSLRPADLGLTPRETDVLRLLIEGKPNKTIGRELNIAESTVKTHAQSACKKLNVTRRTEAIVAVGKMGLILGKRNEQQD
jgi:DNA-binding NarL/FixJ family response regulator